jgi:serine/threonine-protein kinase RsbW
MENLGLAGATARGIAAEVLGADDAGLVELAVTEACSNVIRHGHPDDRDHRFSILFREEDDALVVEIHDVGPEFVFERPVLPDVGAAVEDLPEGGFGVPLIHTTMDSVEHWRTNGENVIRLVKRRPAAA